MVTLSVVRGLQNIYIHLVNSCTADRFFIASIEHLNIITKTLMYRLLLPNSQTLLLHFILFLMNVIDGQTTHARIMNETRYTCQEVLKFTFSLFQLGWFSFSGSRRLNTWRLFLKIQDFIRASLQLRNCGV
jgi:hypothetical protein